MSPRLLSMMAALATACACGPPPRPANNGTPPPAAEVPPGVTEQLTLPPRPATEQALSTLAKHGTCAASWLRARYLLDLFDAARLLPESKDLGRPGLELLWKSLGLPGEASRGRLATQRVLAAMRELLAEKQLAPCARAQVGEVVALLRADEAPRARPQEALQVVVTYKRIARTSSSQLSSNALLRLVDWCAKAFQLAAGGEPRLQHQRLNQCLFPLFDADPRPYFDDSPAARPPDPPWPVLRRRLEGLLARLEGSRLEAIEARLRAQLQRFFAAAPSVLPAPLNLASLELPASTHGVPWARTPAVVATSRGYLVGGRAVLEDDADGLERAIAQRLHNDQRKRIILLAPPDTPGERILTLGRAARKAGARIMDLGVTRVVAQRPAPGDVQALVFAKGPVLRLEGIPVDLTLLSAATPRGYARDLPRGLGYDPRTAPNNLALLIERAGLRISSKHGTLPPVRLRALVAQLRVLKKVYHGDRSLVLAPGRDALYSELVAVAERARRDGSQPLFPGLALGQASRVNNPQDDLTPQLRLLAMARVAVVPELDRSWPGRVRTCYLEALRGHVTGRKPPPEGEVTVVVPRGRRPRLAGKLRHKQLRRCLSKVFESLRLKAGDHKISLRFSLDRG